MHFAAPRRNSALLGTSSLFAFQSAGLKIMHPFPSRSRCAGLIIISSISDSYPHSGSTIWSLECIIKILFSYERDLYIDRAVMRALDTMILEAQPSANWYKKPVFSLSSFSHRLVRQSCTQISALEQVSLRWFLF
jgi:hypothetical protein